MYEINCAQAFQMGSNQHNFKRLVSAKNANEKGLALGYPLEAVQAFKKVITGERRDGSYLHVSLARAKQAGIAIPAWLAYISFVPEAIDLTNGAVSESSKALGEKYQDFVRKNNPDLARRAEHSFFSEAIPCSWEKSLDGSYFCYYESDLVEPIARA